MKQQLGWTNDINVITNKELKKLFKEIKSRAEPPDSFQMKRTKHIKLVWSEMSDEGYLKDYQMNFPVSPKGNYPLKYLRTMVEKHQRRKNSGDL